MGDIEAYYERWKMAKKKMTKEQELNLLERIENSIREIFFECNQLKFDPVERKVSFELTAQKEVKFETLHKLSSLLGTLQINFTGYHNYGGGCETCGWGAAEDMATIDAWDVSPEFFDRMSAPVRG
jgi:hypothetical protein